MSKGYNSDFNNNWATDFVKVELNFTSNSTGKKVFDWNFAVAGKRDRIPVEVKAFNNGSDVWFEASGAHLPERMKNTDINALKEDVLTVLTQQVTLLTNVQWEDWFEVIVMGDNSEFTDSKHSALGANLKIQVNQLKRGVDPVSGKVLTIINGTVTDFPQPTALDGGDTSANGYRIRSAAERSYIPATAENRRSIDNILSRMAELRNSIAGLLSQGNIEVSLVNDVLRALPKPRGPVDGE